MSRAIVHIDLNAFFATCEVLRDPSLKGKPLIVGHTGRSGIVSTCSYEARKYGIHSGQPTFQALRLCPDAIVVEPHFRDYEVYSRSFFSYVRQYTNLIEVASIDECYADFSKALYGVKDQTAFLRKMQFELYQTMGLTCSIGLSATKWLAKMGSDLKKPMGLVILRRKDIETVLYPLPVEQFWGIGKKTAPLLRELGIVTIGDLAKALNADDPHVAKVLGKFTLTARDWINGKGDDQIVTEPEDPKSVGVSHTLSHDCRGLEEVESTLKALCEEVSERAEKKGKVGKGMTLHVKDTSFKTHTKAASFDQPTRDASILFSRARTLYKSFYENMDVRLVGVTLEKLGDKTHQMVQMTLWNYGDYESEDETERLITQMNRKLGGSVLTRLSQMKKGGGGNA